MAPRRPKRPTDPNQLGKLIVDISTGEREDDVPQSKDSPASEFARQGGLKGGKARAESLSPERRREIARIAAERRWAKDGDT
jgi:hypothetical protein